MKLKLYTEEQVRNILNRIVCDDEAIDEYIDRMTPIELPSGDEIINEGLRQKALIFSFMDGAKFIKEQILNQKK